MKPALGGGAQGRRVERSLRTAFRGRARGWRRSEASQQAPHVGKARGRRLETELEDDVLKSGTGRRDTGELTPRVAGNNAGITFPSLHGLPYLGMEARYLIGSGERVRLVCKDLKTGVISFTKNQKNHPKLENWSGFDLNLKFYERKSLSHLIFYRFQFKFQISKNDEWESV
jgi:hypothetical protein